MTKTEPSAAALHTLCNYSRPDGAGGWLLDDNMNPHGDELRNAGLTALDKVLRDADRVTPAGIVHILAHKRDQARQRYEAAHDTLKAAEAAARSAYDAWAAARIDYGRATPPPLADQPVKRVATYHKNIGTWRTVSVPREKTERGTVTLCTTRGTEYRGYSPIAGEWFVLSKSGATAHRLTDDWELDV